VLALGSVMHGWTDLATDLLPKLLQEFVRLIGIEATLRLVERFGGLRIYIPLDPKPEHHLAQLIGLDNLAKLAQVYGGESHFELPKALHALTAVRNAKIRADYRFKSIRELAAEHHLTERHVTRIVAGADVEDPQANLFG
jgi:Mor family transcriptional regulator